MASPSRSGSSGSLHVQLTWARGIRFLAYQHYLMVFLVVAIILLSILIAGCTGENLKDIYLMSLSYASKPPPSAAAPVEGLSNVSSAFSFLAANSTPLEVRVGYMGMCLMTAGQWICSKGPEALESFVHRTVSEDEVGDPLNLIYAAAKFQDEVVFVALLFISIAFAFFACILLATFPGWHEEEDDEGSEREVKPFPSRLTTNGALACMVISSVLGLLSGFWQHLSSSAASTIAQVFTYGTVTGRVGAGAMVLGWLSVFLLAATCFGQLVFNYSLSVLLRMAE